MAKRPLWLLVQSPGGQIPPSYMMARRLRESFSEMIAFVPHVAYSGGTLIALAANEVVMGEFSRLGPLDPQVGYSPNVDSWMMVSALSMQRAFDTLSVDLRTTAREEVGYPQQVLAEKLDPVIMEDWKAESLVVATYLQEVLEKAGYTQKEINSIQGDLVFTSFPHDYVIHRDRAKEYGLKCSPPDSDYLQHLELMQEWLVKYMLMPEFRHYIRFVTPAMEDADDTKDDAGAIAPVEEPTVPSRRVGKREESPVGAEDGARPQPANAGAGT